MKTGYNGGSSKAAASIVKKLLVWDLPVRLFHWSLVMLVGGAIVSGEIGDSWIETHARIGYVVMALLIFRLGWGLVGGRYARFSTYLRSPLRVVAYLRGDAGEQLGYSPLGAIAVTMLMALLWLQALSGLFATDDLMFDGPLRHLVSGSISDGLTAWHKKGALLLFGLLALHLGAIIFYRLVLKDNRVLPMLFGHKIVPADTPDEHAGTAGHPLLALVLLAAGAGIVWYLVTSP
jgi:cytochrome b